LKTIQITSQALAVLSGCTVEQFGPASLVRINEGTLDRKLYVEVNKVLEDIGGKWSRKDKAHLFPTNQGQTTERLDGVILSGEIAPLSKNGFFPTPRVLAATMAVDLRLANGQRILEPSAGSGSLVDAVLAKLDTPRIDTTIRVLELNVELAQKLADKYHDQPTVFVNPTDFLAWSLDGSEYAYDRIIMNPPFENRADAKHVLHAWSLLKDGGRMVAIMGAGVKFRREQEYQSVRALIEDHGTMEDLPEGSFKESGTMVNTVIVVMDK
jgi:phospholipid N-methyltransferase